MLAGDSPPGRAPRPDPELEELERGIELREAGELEESAAVLDGVLRRRAAGFGRSHNLTQVAVSQLGRTLRALGEHERAILLHEESLEHRIHRLGYLHEHTRNSARILAETMQRAGRNAEAEELLARVGGQRRAELARSSRLERELDVRWQGRDVIRVNRAGVAALEEWFTLHRFVVEQREIDGEGLSDGSRTSTTRSYLRGRLDPDGFQEHSGTTADFALVTVAPGGDVLLGALVSSAETDFPVQNIGFLTLAVALGLRLPQGDRGGPI